MTNRAVYDDATASVAGDDTTFADGGSTAFSFTSAVGSAGTLSDVMLDLGDATPADGGTVSAFLCTDSGTYPDFASAVALGTVADSSLTATDGYVDFPIASTIDLAAATRYWIEVTDSATSGAVIGYQAGDAGSGVSTEYFEDSGNAAAPNSVAGADLAEITETVTNSDQAPVVTTSGGETAFTAGTPVAVDGGVTVADPDNSTLASATVGITGNFQAGEDVLAFTNTSASIFGNIAGSYNAGVLTLTSVGDSATVAQFQAALEAVTYTDTVTTPNTLTRTISFAADDGMETGATATKEITVSDSAQSRLDYDNTAEPIAGDDYSFENGGSTAFSFMAAAGGAGTLADVKLDLGDATPSDGGTVTVSLCADSGTYPDFASAVAIGTVADSSLGATPGYVDVPVSSTIDLAAGTRYWIEVTDNASSAAYIGYEAGDAGTGVAGQFFNDGGGDVPDSTGADLAQVTETLDNLDVTTSSGETAFTAGTPVAVDGAVELSDADNAAPTSATVAITGNFQAGEDMLAFTNTSASAFGNIAGSYNAGVLTLTSSEDTATAAQFQAALEAVTYTDTATTPDTLTRTVSFAVDDGIETSAPATKEITVADSAQTRLAYDDTAEPSVGDDLSFEDGGSTAFSFKTTSGSPVTLADVKLDLGDATPSDGGTVGVFLYSNSPAGPGSAIASLGSVADSSLGASPGYVDLPVASTIDLAAGTRYWIELTDSANSAAYIGYDSDDSGTGVANQFYYDNGVVVSNYAGADLAQVTEGSASLDVTTSSGETAVTAGTPAVVDGGVEVADANPTLACATVSITANFQSGEDVLAFDNTSPSTFGDISGSYNAGVLTLTSTGAPATVAQFQAALEAVTYTDAAATPDTLTRTISFVVDDGIETSSPAIKELAVADSAQSRLVYDDTAEPVEGDDFSLDSGASAFSFTTGAAAAGTLADVKLDLGDATPSDGGSVSVSLYSDSSTSPGSLIADLGTVADSALGATDGFVDVPIGTTVDLDAGARYWIELTGAGGSNVHFGFESGDAGTGVSGEFYTAGAAYPNSTGAFLAQVTENVACYRRGTRIRGERGEIAIEHLRIGEKVLTESGEWKPIRWLGHRRIDCRRRADPENVWPVRVSAGAFAEGRPSRDLWLSPWHNIAVDGALIPIVALQNGLTVAQREVASVEYWHVELDRHDIIFAEGLPAESYLDTGNRTAFVDGGAFIEAHPDLLPRHWADTCAPLVHDGPRVERARALLRERLPELGYSVTRDADLHLLVDGERIEPIPLGATRYGFAAPAGARDIRLRSRTFVPAQTLPESSDARSLGLFIGRLQIDGEELALNGDALGDEAWHALEGRSAADYRRWTRGDAPLPENARLVVIELADRGHYWRQPGESAIALRG